MALLLRLDQSRAVGYKSHMVKNTRFPSRMLFFAIFAAVCGGTAFGLVWVNQAMEVRYQTIGVVTDTNNIPLERVEALLLLAPPPRTGPELDSLFRRNAEAQGRLDSDGLGKQPTGPILGLSGPKGIFLVRASGRSGAARAIRMGLDLAGKPPFEVAWLVLRKKGYQDTVITISILGWPPAPKDWGKFANRLPRTVLREN